MKYAVRIGESSRTVEIDRGTEGNLRVHLDGKTMEADVTAIDADTYSILAEGHAYEARVSLGPAGNLGSGASVGAEILLVHCDGQEFAVQVLDPRAWLGAHGAGIEAQGRQQVSAPMPGKVVRVLVAPGDAVQARQGLVVVEAMKMQNEIGAPKSGVVERVFVSEGQTVTAGEALAIVV